LLPELPRLLHTKLAEKPNDASALALSLKLNELIIAQRGLKRRLWVVGALAVAALLTCVVMSYVLWQLMRIMHEAM
jgi:hypothetical protein